MQFPRTIVVTAKLDRMGNVLARPKQDKYARAFMRRAHENGGSRYTPDMWANELSAFFQEGQAASEFLDDCTPAQRKDLESGWDVSFRCDPWIVGHWYGYDAHTIAE